MEEVGQLIVEIETARKQFLQVVLSIDNQQGQWKPTPEAWNAAEITEHLFWAEQAGVLMMWKALEGMRSGKPVFEGENTNKGLSIEQIVERTWKPKETAPENARPRLFGPLSYWVSALESLQLPLKVLAPQSTKENLEEIIYPHVFMGPLNAHQRLEFLRFHLNRHRLQITALKQQLHAA
jgi:hypothetical protein